MALIVPEFWEMFRLPAPRSPYRANYGDFALPVELTSPDGQPRGAYAQVRVCGDASAHGIPWDHVSVTIRAGENEFMTPPWNVMARIKSNLWDAEDCVMQLHPPESQYVNEHAHVLHLWRPINETIPLPPIDAV